MTHRKKHFFLIFTGFSKTRAINSSVVFSTFFSIKSKKASGFPPKISLMVFATCFTA